MADTTERLQQAIAAARAGNIGEAKSMAEQLLEEDPNNPHALFLRGMLAEDTSEQLDYMEKVLTIDPDHKAANKRMSQLAAAMDLEEAAEEEPEDEVVEVTEERVAETIEPDVTQVAVPEESMEPEIEVSTDDATVVAGAAAVGAAVEFADETILAEPEAELGDQDEAFFDVSQPDSDFEEAVSVEVSDETASSEEFVVEEALIDETALEQASSEEEFVELPEDDSIEDTLATGAMGVAAVSAADVMPSEDIPDWLLAEARTEEELDEFDETVLWDDQEIEAAEQLPDWLQDEPGEEWREEEQVAETVVFAETITDEEAVDEAIEEPVTPSDELEGPVDQLDIDEQEPADEELADEEPAMEEPAPEKRKKSSSRNLELALGLLIFIAVLLVAALAFAIINPPF